MQPAQGTTAHSAAGAPLPTTSTSRPCTKRKSTRASSLAGSLFDPSSASPTTTLARQRVSGPTSLLKLPVTAAATTQPKPVVLHGPQQGTRGLKRPHPSSHPGASAAAQASSSAPTQPAQGTTAHSAAGVFLPTTSPWSLAATLSKPSSASHTTTLARQRVSGSTSVLKLPMTAAATTQHKPVVIHGQHQGTRGLKRACPSSDLAASALSTPTKRKSTWAAGLAGTLSNPSSDSLITALARLTISGRTSAITQPKTVVLHGQQQGTRTLKQVHPYSRPTASAAAQVSSSAPAQGTTAHSAAGVSLPTTSTWSLAETLSNPSSASHTTTLARQRVSGPTSLLKLPVTAAATTQHKPVVIHGQQQGTRGLKRARPSSDPAASALSPPTKRKLTRAAGLAGTLSNPSSDSLITALARLTISGHTSLRKLAIMAAAITQPKPVVLHGQQQGTRALRRVHPYSRPAASAPAQASSSAPRQPAQGTTAHLAAGVFLPTTSTSSQAGTLSNLSFSRRDAHAALSDCTPAKVRRLR
uniref:mucin-5AC-like n=1 Tax=Callithrix jacchus TaxID=9483 RepID=UPI0023DD0768|nr:mucin-5AC-like [Callithrix jacchus]XP_054100642.1 mucin-5AC-like [Callithrix jacchus]